MIARLSGRLVGKSPGNLIVDVNGVGYQVLVSLTTFCALPETGAPVSLEVHTHLRENAIELFGFIEPLEKAVFGALLAVSGVGPRMALNILSGMPTAELIQSLATGDVARLVSVPGVGKKTAERLVVELQDRLQKLNAPAAEPQRQRTQLESEAISALVNLGYRGAEAERAVRQAMSSGPADLAAVIKQSLQRLGR